jgi:hypothetical protein
LQSIEILRHQLSSTSSCIPVLNGTNRSNQKNSLANYVT